MKAEYLNHMGNDLDVANAARVSFDAESTELTQKDKGLIQFLARGCSSKDWDSAVEDLYGDPMLTKESINELLKWAKNMPEHWTPFAHCTIRMRETIPIFVARQRFKHAVGFVYNETSRRYVDDTPEFHYPDSWRARPEGGIKQGSGSEHPEGSFWSYQYQRLIFRSEAIYRSMIQDGVAPEQARMVLPQSMMTQYWVTGSLYAWANAYIQRSDSHAQQEIQALAAQWDTIIRPLFPVAWSALVD